MDCDHRSSMNPEQPRRSRLTITRGEIARFHAVDVNAALLMPSASRRQDREDNRHQ